MIVTSDDFYQIVLTINMIVGFVYKIYKKQKITALLQQSGY